MRKMWKRVLSLVVSTGLVLGMVPMSSYAQTVETTPDEDTSIVETVPEETSGSSEDVIGEKQDPSDEQPEAEKTEQSDDQEEVLQKEEQSDDQEEKVVSQPAENNRAGRVLQRTAPGNILQDSDSTPEFQIMSLDTDIDVSTEAGYFWYGTFTAPEDGTYNFFSEGDMDTYGYLYSDANMDEPLYDDDDNGTGSNFNIGASLEKDQTVYLKVKEFNVDALHCTIRVTRFDESDLTYGGIHLAQIGYEPSDEAITLRGVQVFDYKENELSVVEDYQLVYVDESGVESDVAPNAPGNYSVYAAGVNGYKGKTTAVRFIIYDPSDLECNDGDYWSTEYEGGSSVLLGETTLPKLDIYHWNADNNTETHLVEDTDFELVNIVDAVYDEEPEDYGKTIPNKAGEYVAYYTGINGYKGTRGISFVVLDSNNLESALYGGYLWYVGLEKNVFLKGTSETLSPKIYRYINDYSETISLVKDEDFILDHIEADDGSDEPEKFGTEIPGKAGKYFAVLVGKGSYTGTRYVRFEVFETYDLSCLDPDEEEYEETYYWEASFDNSAIPAGSDLPTPTFCHREDGGSKVVLVENKDYELDHVARRLDSGELEECGTTLPEEAGYYYVYYEGKTPYYGTRELSLVVYDPYSLEREQYIDGGSEYYWNLSFVGSKSVEVGTSTLPALSVYHYEDEDDPETRVELTEGTDYVLDHIEDYYYDEVPVDYGTTIPKKAGEYRAFYRGDGDYSGMRSVYFTVYDPYDLSTMSYDSMNCWGDYWDCFFGGSEGVLLGSTKLPEVNIRHYLDEDYEEKIVLTEGEHFKLDHIESVQDEYDYDDDFKPENYGTTVPQKAGKYCAYYVGIEPYYGKIGATFTVYDQNDLGAYINYEPYWIARFVNGDRADLEDVQGLTPEIYHEEGGIKTILKEGTDYELVDVICLGEDKDTHYGATFPTEVGYYRAYYEGKGQYTGRTYIFFQIINTKDLGCTYEDGPHIFNYWIVSFKSVKSVPLGSTTPPSVDIWHSDNDDYTYGYDEPGDDVIILKEGTDFVLDHIEDATDDEEPENYGTSVPQKIGEYRAVYRGNGKYTGTISVKFKVYDLYDLGSKVSEWNTYWYCEFRPNSMIEAGSDKLPTPIISHPDDDGDTILTEGTDYVLDHIEDAYYDEEPEYYSEDVPQNPGNYRAVYRGEGKYTGTISATFSVYDPYDLECRLGDHYDYWQRGFTSGFMIELGSDKFPTMMICHEDEDGDIVLTEGKDYVLEYITDENGNKLEGTGVPQTEGNYYAYYSGQTPYYGTVKCEFAVGDKTDIGGPYWECYFEKDNTFYLFNNKVYGFPPSIHDRSACEYLHEGEDFEFVGYLDENGKTVENLTLGNYYYSVFKGINGYKGQAKAEFYLKDGYELAYMRIGLEQRVYDYTGQPVSLVYQLVNYIDYQMQPGTDYELEFSDENFGSVAGGVPVEKGKYYVRAKAKQGSGFKGETSWWMFEIAERPTLGPVEMSLDEQYDVYMGYGEEWKGIFSAPEDGFYIFESISYEDTCGLIYSDAEYSDYLTDDYDSGDGLNFRIGLALKKGETVYPAARLEGGSFAGFKVKITKGDDKNLANGEISFDFDDLTVSGNCVIPGILVKDACGNILTKGTDYELKYYLLSEESYKWNEVSGYNQAGTYMVIAVAKEGSGCSGQMESGSFLVQSSKDLRTAEIGGRQTFQVGDTDIEESITVTDPEGNVLKQGVDYVLVFYQLNGIGPRVRLDEVPTEAGSYQVVAEAKGDTYTGKTNSFAIDIVESHDISGGELQLSGAYYYDPSMDYMPVYLYTGSAVTPVEGVLDSNGNLLDSECYTITYENNDVPSEEMCALVKVEAKAPYTGSITTEFAIVEKLNLLRMFNQHGILVSTGSVKYHIDSDDKITTFNLSDWTGTPDVGIHYNKEEVIGQSGNFTVSYVDEAGNTLTQPPTTAGKYQMVLTSVDDGIFTGTCSTYIILKDDDISKATVTLSGSTFAYNGKAKNPTVKSVVLNGKELEQDVDYKVTEPTGRVNAGTYTYTITGINGYKGTATAKMTITKADSTIKIAQQTKKFTGKALAYTGKVKKTGSTGKVTCKYYLDAKCTKGVSAANVKLAKTYYVRAKLAADANHEAATSNVVKFVIAKAVNPMKVTVKSATLSFATLKTKSLTTKRITITKNKGALTCKLVSVAPTANKKYFAVNAKTGVITVKRGLKKGTYTIKVSVKAAGNANYKALTKTVTFKIIVK